MITRIFATAAVFALLTVPAPARAAIVEWNLDNVGEVANAHPSITFQGFFDYDTVNSIIGFHAFPDFSITAFNTGIPFFTWSPLNSSGFFFGFGVGEQPTFQVNSNPPDQLFLALTAISRLVGQSHQFH